MKLGIVDLGTNSLRFDIYSISKHKKPALLYHEKDMIRLGEEVWITKKLSPKAIHKTLKRLKIIQTLSQKYKVDQMICHGTSPLREAKNAQKLLAKIKKTTGFHFQPLSGKKEALLIAKAMTHFHPTPQKTILIDIGGGSTEISMAHQGKILFSKSVKLGSMRLQHQFLKKIPPTGQAIEHLKNHIQKTLKILRTARDDSQIPYKAIGSAGTIKALAKVAGHSQTELKTKDLEQFLHKIRQLKLQSLRRLLKTEGRRGDILFAGTLLLLEIMRFFHLQSIKVTKKGLRDGILLDFIQKYAKKHLLR